MTTARATSKQITKQRKLINKLRHDAELFMRAKHYGIDIVYDNKICMIASYDEDRLTFVTVENVPQIIYSIDEAIEHAFKGLRTKEFLAFTALFCLLLFEALHDMEKNLTLPPSQ